jgi:glycerol-3-phosphate acyltransferase PlsY
MEFFSIAREWVLICFGYILGCFSTGYYLVRYRTGLDLRTQSSRSTGSANAARVLGKPGYYLTLAGDALKAAVALGMARHFGASPWAIACVIVAVIAGHIWPIQLGFHGGKGLAPALGILAILDWRATLIAGAVALIGPIFGWGKATFLLAALISPFVIAFLNHGSAEITGMAALAALVLIAHRDNIRDFVVEKRGRKGLEA